MPNNQSIFESLFNRKFSDTGNIDFLKELTAKHPYFSPAQFFLLQKTKQDSFSFDKQVNRTNILFNNPLWLNFQIKQTEVTAEREVDLESVAVLPHITETTEDIVQEPEHVKPEEESTVHPVENKMVEPVLEIIDDSPDNTEAAEETGNEPEPMKIELKMPEQKLNLSEAMLFEPMHIVDYFASQGIKLSEEVQTADKLGKQLKSFTEWLKIMKKVHVENEVETTAQTDNNVQALAENSNTSTEVLTESMAEVFARQGKTDKASEVYQKLSLLNPAKSTYFAAKIENLKGI